MGRVSNHAGWGVAQTLSQKILWEFDPEPLPRHLKVTEHESQVSLKTLTLNQHDKNMMNVTCTLCELSNAFVFVLVLFSDSISMSFSINHKHLQPNCASKSHETASLRLESVNTRGFFFFNFILYNGWVGLLFFRKK